MKRISGRDNQDFKRFLAVRNRKDRDHLLVEGEKMIDEAIRSGARLRAVAFDPKTIAVARALAHDVPVVSFSDSLFRAISEVEAPQGVMALVERPRFDERWLLRERAFILVLDSVQDPGNVGTLFRTAEAAGVSGLVLTPGCADPFSSKVLRASAGSVFRVPHLAVPSPEALLDVLPPGLSLIATSVEEGTPSLFEADAPLPLALALGSEGAGLDPRIAAKATHRVRVPQARPVESLNVAIAGALAMFEIARRAGILRN